MVEKYVSSSPTSPSCQDDGFSQSQYTALLRRAASLRYSRKASDNLLVDSVQNLSQRRPYRSYLNGAPVSVESYRFSSCNGIDSSQTLLRRSSAHGSSMLHSHSSLYIPLGSKTNSDDEHVASNLSQLSSPSCGIGPSFLGSCFDSSHFKSSSNKKSYRQSFHSVAELHDDCHSPSIDAFYSFGSPSERKKTSKPMSRTLSMRQLPSKIPVSAFSSAQNVLDKNKNSGLGNHNNFQLKCGVSYSSIPSISGNFGTHYGTINKGRPRLGSVGEQMSRNKSHLPIYSPRNSSGFSSQKSSSNYDINGNNFMLKKALSGNECSSCSYNTNLDACPSSTTSHICLKSKSTPELRRSDRVLNQHESMRVPPNSSLKNKLAKPKSLLLSPDLKGKNYLASYNEIVRILKSQSIHSDDSSFA